MFIDETIVVDLTFLHADGDLDLKLYDADVTPDDLWNHQVASSVTVNDNEQITFTNETGVDATFYLRVYGWNLQDRTTYSLGVTFQ
jgi:hypothetical protein